ncbi:Probable S8 subtilisin family serine endopeptidase precursor containing a type A C-terminal secretion signal [Tenacibaculum sp. 190524A02b]|uniref:S8 family serine peptidase n=1 Tax=Tenacibaculum vairaonense TaxID=3137860 RepID=UPI0032B261AC
MKKLILFYFQFLALAAIAQTEDAWVYFSDKPDASTYLAEPTKMLSQRSLDRRTKQNIALDNKDVPIDKNYYAQVKSVVGITVMAKSKWLNALHVRGTQANINALVTNLSFVEKVEFANRTLNSITKTTEIKKQAKNTTIDKFAELQTDFNYGVTNTQVTMLNANVLHKEGYTGAGMQIAVIDAGFPNVNTLDAFKRLRDNNQILGGYDFVNRSDNFYSGHNHGTNVLSDIGGYLENEFVGTAPDASFYLFTTEDVSSEGPIEESLWVEAAERADSLGVDIINTSLGYYEFDNTAYNHVYADMDGKTTFISRGAEIGASRGMILVTSAGNEGQKAWKYITAPADAPSVFTVGAVSDTEVIMPFSSYGPTADGRVKPDVLAHGGWVYIIDHNTGKPKQSFGTSFAGPVMAGAVACFWQAFPNLTYKEIMQKVRESADRYTNPTDQHGHGIPDFSKAYMVLSVEDLNQLEGIKVYPNPTQNYLVVDSNKNNLDISIFNALGSKIYTHTSTSKNIDVSKLTNGMYILQLKKGSEIQTVRFLKK